jgi:hypothetical protein
MPTSTDLVTDLPADFNVFGQGVDTSMADLLGGTTGQVLSKTSATNMDFTWVTPQVGDITSVVAGTGLTGGGTSGAVTLTFDEANYGGGQYAAGKNAVINGAMNNWQRGTTFSNLNGYFADRFLTVPAGAVTTMTTTQQSFTAGTAPVAGYEASFFARNTITTVGTLTNLDIQQRIENVRTFAGDTVTLSFWAKADSARTSLVYLLQNFGSGGSGDVYSSTPALTLTTSWARYSFTISVASISGKTIGTSSYLAVGIRQVVSAGSVIDIWGVQLEEGSTATPFQTASGTIQGELALCQRYYWRTGGDSAYNYYGSGINGSTTIAACTIPNPVTLRVAATSVDYNLVALQEDTTGGIIAVTSITNGLPSKTASSINATVASGLTKYRPVMVLANNSTSSYLGFSAEL